MTKGQKIVLSAAAILAAALALFILGAYFGYSHARSYFGSRWLDEQSNDIRSRLVMLGYLRGGDAKKATEMMEDLMYDDLIALEPDRFIDRRTKNNINQTLAEVRAYRSNNPYARRPMIDRMVEQALAHPPY
jgi:hypothetical protein